MKINKRVVLIKEHVVGKTVPERIGVWTWQLGTPEYLTIIWGDFSHHFKSTYLGF